MVPVLFEPEEIHYGGVDHYKNMKRDFHTNILGCTLNQQSKQVRTHNKLHSRGALQRLRVCTRTSQRA